MIFISYNHDDKDLVDMIARRLEIEFGRDNIFYDKWSISPGESIIDKMATGLENYSAFFFMFSTNSLKSKMVTKEWQSALMRKIGNESLKFVPVRIDDCNPPAILADQKYINLYGEGLDSAVTQMNNVVKNESTYIPNEDISNIQYEKEIVSNLSIKVTVYATMYSENNLDVGIIVPGFSISDLNFDDVSELMTGGASATINLDGRKEEVKIVGLMRPLTVDRPFYVTITSKNDEPIRDILIGKRDNNGFQFIPEKN